MLRIKSLLLSAALAMIATPAVAQEVPVPYWSSIRATEVNMRVGPAESYKIMWVYKRVGLPMKVVRRKDGWRLVEDPDGARGWVLSRFLARDRSVFVTEGDNVELRMEPSSNSRTLWLMEPGVTAKLEQCKDGWCALDVGGHKGFAREERLWGTGEP